MLMMKREVGMNWKRSKEKKQREKRKKEEGEAWEVEED